MKTKNRYLRNVLISKKNLIRPSIYSMYFILLIVYIFYDSFIGALRGFYFGPFSIVNIISLIVLFFSFTIYSLNYKEKITNIDVLYFLLFFFPVLFVFPILLTNRGFVYDDFITGYINYVIVLILLILSIKIIGNISLELTFMKLYNDILIILTIIGYLQFFGILNFASARSYLTYTGDIPIVGNIIRMTSIFNEPSSFSFFLIIGLVFSLALNKRIIFNYFLITSLFTLSLTAYFLIAIFLILYFNIIFNKKNKLIFAVIAIVGFLLGSNIFIIFFRLIYSRVSSGNFGSYRVEAPIKTLIYLFNNPYLIISGIGIGQFQYLSESLNLSEEGMTTHNIFVDLLTELGILGLTSVLLTLLNYFLRNKKLVLFITIVLATGVGYRSPRFILIFLLLSFKSLKDLK